MSSVRRINVVFIYVADPGGVRPFYEDLLGFGAPSVDVGDWIEYALPGGCAFALHRTIPEALEGTIPQRNTMRCSFEVEGLDELCARLREAGVEFIRMPETGYGFRLAEVLDPEGNPIRLIERVKA